MNIVSSDKKMSFIFSSILCYNNYLCTYGLFQMVVDMNGLFIDTRL